MSNGTYRNTARTARTATQPGPPATTRERRMVWAQRDSARERENLTGAFPTKDEFFCELAELAPFVVERMGCVRQACAVIGITRSHWYKWVRGEHAPLLLTRRAMLALCRELAKPGAAEQEAAQ